MVGRPAAWKCPASVANETAIVRLERVSRSASASATEPTPAASGGTSTSIVVSIAGPETKRVSLGVATSSTKACTFASADAVVTPGRPRNSQLNTHSRANMLRAVPLRIMPDMKRRIGRREARIERAFLIGAGEAADLAHHIRRRRDCVGSAQRRQGGMGLMPGDQGRTVATLLCASATTIIVSARRR